MTLDKTVIWKNDDGSIQVTKFIKSSQVASGLTEDEFISLHLSRMQKSTMCGNKKFFLMDKSRVSDFFAGVDKKDHERVRIDNNGRLSVDHSVVTQSELKSIAMNNLKAKLKLTDNEFSLLTRGA